MYFFEKKEERITGREELKRNILHSRCLSGKVERLRSETIKMSKFSTHNEHERNGRRGDSDNGDDELELARLPRFYLTCYSVFRSSCIFGKFLHFHSSTSSTLCNWLCYTTRTFSRMAQEKEKDRVKLSVNNILNERFINLNFAQ